MAVACNRISDSLSYLHISYVCSSLIQSVYLAFNLLPYSGLFSSVNFFLTSWVTNRSASFRQKYFHHVGY